MTEATGDRVGEAPPGPESPAAPQHPPRSVVPGAPRGGFTRLPTTPLDVPVTPVHLEPEADAEEIVPPRGIAGWALGFGVAGLLCSLLVGWAFPLGAAALVMAIMALRQPWESRALGVWAVSIASVSLLYSAGWLVYAALPR